ncbi:MAG: hypothetical protein IVW57_02545 [Ktedonobacterales bacterium]|nr:hypothetical protein [Ktedonobacterales bacterium]
MGIIRHRDSVEIREQALRSAVQKHDTGCPQCAEGYVRLARQHGATAGDFERAGVGRRGFLKMAAAALAAGVAVDLLLPARRARAAQAQVTTGITGYFGVDSCTTPEDGAIAGMPLQFYIGELGATNFGLACFNTATAQYVGLNFAHGYWGLSGPGMMGSAGVTDLATYGKMQAQQAIAAWNVNHSVAGKTIFADIEYGFGGWGDNATPEQQATLLDAFMVTLAQEGFVPGVYISDSAKVAWFPPTYIAAVPFVYWVAGGPYAGTMCGPCTNGCDTLGPVQGYWQQAVSQAVFAGQSAIIWQYWLSGFGCSGDFNYSPQTGQSNFTPGPLPLRQ